MNGESAQDRKLKEALETLAGFRKSTGGRALTVSELNAVNERITAATKAVEAAERKLVTVNTSLALAREQIAAFASVNLADLADADHEHTISEVENLPAELEAIAVSLGDMVSGGSNANGRFIRFSSGWQICWIYTRINTSLSAGAYTEATWTYPAAFVSGSTFTPFAVVRSFNTAAGREDAARYLRPASSAVGATTGVLGVVNLHSSAVTAVVDGYIIGKWL